jgi:phosphonate transport system substrate-binding protein
MIKGRTTIVLLLLLALLNIGCERTNEQRSQERTFVQQEILIGLIPEQNIFRQRERYQWLKQYLYDQLHVTVTFTSLSRYGNLIDHFAAEKMDGAFFGSFTYGLARHQLGVEPLVRPVNIDGTSTYHGYLFTRKDSGIRRAADMRGKRFAFVERATTAGYLFPLAFFKANGITNLHAYLGEMIFTGSHDAAIEAVLNREADVGAAKNTIYEQLSVENSRIYTEMVVLASSGAVPENCLAVRKDLDPELKVALKHALLDMDKNEDGKEALRMFGARGFIETNDGDYAYFYKLVREVGINLKTYRYNNR